MLVYWVKVNRILQAQTQLEHNLIDAGDSANAVNRCCIASSLVFVEVN